MKIQGQELGQDPWETYRVEDGLLTLNYENYDGFQNRFGHLFYEKPFSHYLLRIEYRFIGDQLPDAPTWAFKNNGVMFHAQDPQTMLIEQRFPLSIEAQLLGGNGTEERSTANACTPGTHIEVGGERAGDGCVPGLTQTYHGEEWVTLDLLVLGDSVIAHIMDGDTVLAYSNPIIGGGTVEDFGVPAAEEGAPLGGGYIALQSESHPIQFRQIRLKDLSSGY
jgi:hypothetical protein